MHTKHLAQRRLSVTQASPVPWRRVIPSALREGCSPLFPPGVPSFERYICVCVCVCVCVSENMCICVGMYCVCISHSVVSDSLQPHGL